MKRLIAMGLVLLAACSDALEQDTTVGQVVAVVNTGANTVSLIDATAFTEFLSIPLTAPAGMPSTIAARKSVLVVPLGQTDAVEVIDFAGQDRVVALAAGAGASGVAIQDDSIAWVANPNANRATLVNYRSGDTSSLPVGVYPQAVVVVGGNDLYVINANLVNGQPAGQSWITFLGLGPVVPIDSIPLTGTNARFAALGDDGFLYVVNAGSAGRADGKLSIVDPMTNDEVAVINGLGESPGPAVYHPSGRLLIASRTEGILEVSTLTRALTRGPGDGVKPGGGGVSALVVNSRGRVYAVAPGDCSSPGVVHVLSAPPDYRLLRAVTVGVCPSAAAVAVVP